MIDISQKEVWFVTGSQHLYGDEALQQVASHSEEVAKALNNSSHVPLKIVYKQLLTTPDEITQLMLEANSSQVCIGLIAWMHTFSPAKMWITGLNILKKPLVHLHTQFNAEIPWSSIDMDFMNLNQSAHGDREFGFMMTRMRKNRKVITGHWKSDAVQQKIGTWCRVAAGWSDMQGAKIARLCDNMREVAVTEGDKVEAQMKFGFSVNGYDIPDLTKHFQQVGESEVKQLLDEYEASYDLTSALQKGGDKRSALEEAAKIELGLRSFLTDGGFKGFTDTFESLGTLKQLPGIAVQRLMADGYGFGAEGDWKTAALLRAMKVMNVGLDGGTSFMEDYTYHFGDDKSYVLGSHMLEICSSIAQSKPSCEIHPLSIGGKEDPVRLVFNTAPGNAINASLVDMGNRFRLLVNVVEAVKPLGDLPNLPVARVLWDAKPNLEIAATAWILGGGAHHTVYSQALTTEYMEDFAEMAGIELLVIDNDTKIRSFKDTLHANEVYYHLFQNGI